MNASPLFRREKRAPSRGMAAVSLSAGICLAASFLNFLNHHGYPIARSEVVISLAIFSFISIVFGLICARLRPREQMLLFAIFLAFVIPINFGGSAWLTLVTIAAAILLKNRSLPFAGLTFLVVLLFQVAQLGTSAGAVAPEIARPERARLPVIVHVLLDEAIGIEGLPRDIPEAAEAAAWGKAMLLHSGFVLFGRAYADHMHTVNSVPDMLDFGAEGEVEKEGAYYRLGPNRYMAALKKSGYAITVFQNPVGDYCGNPQVDLCRTSDAYRALAQSALSTHDKTVVLLRAFATLSDPVVFLAHLYDILLVRLPPLADLLPPLRWEQGRLPTALGGMDTLDRLIRRVAVARPGEAYFAHVLLPHYPYAFDAACRLKPEDEWMSRHSLFRSRRERYDAYLGQWRCAIRRIADLVQALEASRPDDDFLVIVHGDHGSRITSIDPDTGNADALSPQTFRDAYSTLAAVRMPGLRAGYVADDVPVRAILEALATGHFRPPLAVEAVESPRVVLERSGSNLPGKLFAVPDLFERD